MATREIEETALLNMAGVNRAVDLMMANKEARALLLKARKISDPSAVIPEIDAAEPVNAQVDEIKKMMAEEKAAREADKAERAQAEKLAEFARGWEKQRSKLRADGWRDEGIENIEKLAQERGIPDLEVAAAYFEKLHPPAEPVQPNGSGSWGFFGDQPEDDTFIKAMLASRGDDEAALDREIAATLKDFRSQTGARR